MLVNHRSARGDLSSFRSAAKSSLPIFASRFLCKRERFEYETREILSRGNFLHRGLLTTKSIYSCKQSRINDVDRFQNPRSCVVTFCILARPRRVLCATFLCFYPFFNVSEFISTEIIESKNFRKLLSWKPASHSLHAPVSCDAMS